MSHWLSLDFRITSFEKTNIAILSYRSAPFGGGQGIYVHDISKALSIMGHEVDIISGPPYPNLCNEG